MFKFSEFDVNLKNKKWEFVVFPQNKLWEFVGENFVEAKLKVIKVQIAVIKLPSVPFSIFI